MACESNQVWPSDLDAFRPWRQAEARLVDPREMAAGAKPQAMATSTTGGWSAQQLLPAIEAQAQIKRATDCCSMGGEKDGPIAAA